MKKDFRPLMAEEVECRIDSIGQSTVGVVVYITARSAMNILDEIYGSDNWSKKIRVEKKSADTPYYAVCSIEVQDSETGLSIIREDVGEDPASPKAASSDALKRAAMNLVPSLRALYTVPQIRIKAARLGIKLSNASDRDQCVKEIKDALRNKKLKVSSISFGKGVAGLFVKTLSVIEDDTGEIVHEFISKTREFRAEESPAVADLRARMVDAHITEEQMLSFYPAASSLEAICGNKAMFADALLNLESRTKSIAAKRNAKGSGRSINDQLGAKEA